MKQKRFHWQALYRELVCHPEGEHYKKLGKVGWLMVYILTEAGDDGIYTGSSQKIADDMGLYILTVRAWLRHLERSKYITIEGRWDSMKIKILKPSGAAYTRKAVEKGKSAKKSKNNSANDNDNINIYNNDNDSNDNDGTSQKLTAEYIAKSFGDEDNIAFYIHAFGSYPEKVIRKAFQQVNTMPARKIKRSRGALFNYLLKKFNEESYEK